jgi:hypothetical protein
MTVADPVIESIGDFLAQVADIKRSWFRDEDRARDLERAITAGGTPNSRRIHGCDGSNGRR